MNRRSFLLATAALVSMPRSGAAQFAVADAGSYFHQILAYIEQIAQYAQQVQAYSVQLQQYANMVRNTTALPMSAWNTVQSDIMQVHALSNAGALLAGNSGSMIARLNNSQVYLNQIGNLASIPGQMQTYQQTISNNLTTMGQTLGLQQKQAQNSAALIQQIQAHSTSANGQLAAIQAATEMSGANANALLQIRETLAATAQMQATAMAEHGDRQALNDAAIQAFAAKQAVPLSGYRQW